MVAHGEIQAINGLILYRGSAHYRGIAPYPKFAVSSDTWEELDAFGNTIGDWIYNGNYWLSRQLYYERAVTTSAAFSSTALTVDFPIDESKNLWIENLVVNVQVNAASTGTNFWLFALSRSNAAGTGTAINSLSTNGLAANTWANYKVPVNVHVNVAATATKTLRIVESRTGTLNKRGTAGYEYRKVRP